jgi:hypothetical protein
LAATQLPTRLCKFSLSKLKTDFNLEKSLVSTVQVEGNNPPYFADPIDWPYFKVLTRGKSWAYQLPEIVNDDKDNHGVLKSVTL